MRSEEVVRSLGQCVQVGDLIIEVIATHPRRTRLRITAPDGVHMVAELNKDDIERRFNVVEGTLGWRFLRPRNGGAA